MKTVLSFLCWMLTSQLLLAQSGFAESYDATNGFSGTLIANTTYGYKVFANKTSAGSNMFTHMTFETGPDGAFWGVTSTIDYPQAAGALTDVGPSGDYTMAETFATPGGIALRIRRYWSGVPGYYNNLAEINFPEVSSLSLDRLVFNEGFPGGVYLAGHYRTLAEPNIPVAFLVRSSTSAFQWWIQTLADIPAGSFAFTRLTAFSDGGCAVVFKKNDETQFIERFGATGASLWRRQVGWLTTTVSSLTEGPGGLACYTLINLPFSGPSPTYGVAAAIAANGTVVFDKDLNALLGQYSVFPRYMLPLSNGETVLAGFESPVFPGAGSLFFVAKLDPSGQLIWKKRYYYFPYATSFNFGKTTQDNGYIFTGTTNGKTFLFKIDQNGEGPADTQYCPATAEEPWHEWIAGVQVGSIQNPSGKSQYSNFYTQSTDLGIGQQAEINITAGYSYLTYDQYFRVWIDYNRDNIFGSDEMAFETKLARPPHGTPTKLLTTNFTVPDSVQPGPTRMRIIMQRDAYPAPCGNVLYGEVEDYSVQLRIAGPAPDLTTPAWELIPANNSCFTNPGQAFAFLAGLVLNTGSAGAGHFTAKAWLSADEQFGNTDDVLWQSVQYDTTAPNGVPGNPLGLNISNPVPFSMTAGIYHFFVQVDADNAVVELDESNNLFQSTVQIGAPDYLLQNLTGVPDTLATGSHLTGTLEIAHSNLFPLAGLTGGVEVSIFLSTDNIPNNGNEILLGTQMIGFDAFNAAGIAEKVLSLPLPAIATAGIYFLIAQVSPTNYCDQNYQNNTLVGPEIQITGAPSGAYCGAQGNFPWHDWIAGVSVANMANGSGKSMYSDFSDLKATLVINTSAPVALTAGYSWTGYDEFWKIWIDYNQDGIFDALDELVFQQFLPAPTDGTPNASVFGSFNVPATAETGTTRMRVAMKRFAAQGPSPCEHFDFGEVEDYGVEIVSSFQMNDARARTVTATGAPDFELYPNPAASDVFLKIPEASEIVSLKFFDQNGLLKQESFFEKTDQNLLHTSLKGFQNGIYWIQIRTDSGSIVCKKLVVIR